MSGGAVICPRCKRVAVGWPLKRGDVCAPKYYTYCLREPSVIRAKAAKKARAA